MLSIRMQRLGRKGHPVYRVVVQDKRQSPDSGKYIALLGSYDPHTKAASITKDKAEYYLKNGAQPSERVVKLFKEEKISLPKWVNEFTKQERKIRNPEKLRKNRPAEEVKKPSAEKPEESTAEEKPAEENEVKAEAETKQIAEEAPKKEEKPDTTEEKSDEGDKDTEPEAENKENKD